MPPFINPNGTCWRAKSMANCCTDMTTLGTETTWTGLKILAKMFPPCSSMFLLPKSLRTQTMRPFSNGEDVAAGARHRSLGFGWVLESLLSRIWCDFHFPGVKTQVNTKMTWNLSGCRSMLADQMQSHTCPGHETLHLIDSLGISCFFAIEDQRHHVVTEEQLCSHWHLANPTLAKRLAESYKKN